MALLDSLLSAIVRAEGDALVMHVGERPYVVVGTQTINISTHGMNLDAMTGMMSQLLPGDALTQLEEFGAVEYKIPQQGEDRFSVVAARGGDDIWIEMRRRRPQPAAVPPEAAPAPPPPVEVQTVAPPPAAAEPLSQPAAEPMPAAREMPVHWSAEPDTVAVEAPAAPAPEPAPVEQPEPIVEAPPLVDSVEWTPPPLVDSVEWTPPPLVDSVEWTPPPTEHLQAVVEDIPVVAEAVTPPLEPIETIAAPLPTIELIEPIPEEAVAQVNEPMVAAIEPPAAPTIEETVQPPAPEPGVVLPMTRTVRIEVPPRTTTTARPATGIDRLLRVAAAQGATALYLTSDSRPWIRIEGDLRYLDSESPLSRADVESAILEIAPESGHETIGRGEATEWLAEFEGLGRIRCTTFADHRGPGVLLRMIATRAATAEQLGLAREVQALATESQGLVLVAGTRASGKSTLISALVDLVNRQRAEYVITLERQIRLVHDNRLALVSQREIRGGADASVAAARAALRENPDVLVVDDLVSSHMVPLLLTAASEGLLIFVSITAPSTADAVARFVELAPPEMRKAVQAAMAESFRGAVAQALLKKAGGGLVAAREVLLATAPVTRVIHEGQLGQLPLALESGRKHGMVSFTDALGDFVRTGTVDVREAFRKAPDRPRLLETLKRDGIDTSVVERLA